MVTVGVVGTGSMGSALGAGWREGGHRVVTCLAGRSRRSRSMASAAGLEPLPSMDDLVRASDLVACVVPPGQAVAAARRVAEAARRTGAGPLVLDLNAVSPATVRDVASVLAAAGCGLVDGSVSGSPPAPSGEPTRVYLSGPGAVDVSALPNPRVEAVVLGETVGTASALKMCTASLYKGTKALVMQALVTAEEHGVTDAFLEDTTRAWPDDVPGWPRAVAVSASKAWRFVDEMHEIAATQAEAGVAPELFEGVAAAYAWAATTEAGARSPEDVPAVVSAADVVADLRSGGAG